MGCHQSDEYVMQAKPNAVNLLIPVTLGLAFLATITLYTL